MYTVTVSILTELCEGLQNQTRTEVLTKENQIIKIAISVTALWQTQITNLLKNVDKKTCIPFSTIRLMQVSYNRNDHKVMHKLSSTI